MVVRGLRGDVELAGRLLRRVARGDQAQDLDLSRGSGPRDAWARPGARRCPAHVRTASTASGQSLPSLTAARTLAAAATSLRRRRGTRLARRLEGLGRRENAHGGRQIRAAPVAGDSGTVDALVVALHQRGGRAVPLRPSRRGRARRGTGGGAPSPSRARVSTLGLIHVDTGNRELADVVRVTAQRAARTSDAGSPICLAAAPASEATARECRT